MKQGLFRQLPSSNYPTVTHFGLFFCCHQVSKKIDGKRMGSLWEPHPRSVSCCCDRSPNMANSPFERATVEHRRGGVVCDLRRQSTWRPLPPSTLWSWPSHLTPLSLSLLKCELKRIVSFQQSSNTSVRLKWANVYSACSKLLNPMFCVFV